jgi:hypothetical protein
MRQPSNTKAAGGKAANAANEKAAGGKAANGTNATNTVNTARLASAAPNPWLRGVVIALAVIYLADLWLDGVGSGIPNHLLPRPLHFFTQAAQLFPRAADDIIEWRAKGWRCDARRFEELDVRPYFPIHADDKENRFGRAMFFYYRQRRVMEALDQYISAEERARGNPLGGVMLMSLRVPIPEPGTQVPRYRRVPVEEYPPSVVRKYWYVTPTTERERRCSGGDPP